MKEEIYIYILILILGTFWLWGGAILLFMREREERKLKTSEGRLREKLEKERLKRRVKDDLP
jgi:hypothetical protein